MILNAILMVGCACFLGRRFVANQQGAMGLQGACDYTETQVDVNGKLIGDQAESDWLKVTPWGFRLMLNWVNNRCASAAHHHVSYTYGIAGEELGERCVSVHEQICLCALGTSLSAHTWL